MPLLMFGVLWFDCVHCYSKSMFADSMLVYYAFILSSWIECVLVLKINIWTKPKNQTVWLPACRWLATLIDGRTYIYVENHEKNHKCCVSKEYKQQINYYKWLMEDRCGTNVFIDTYVCFKLSSRLFAPYLQTLMLQKRVIHEHTINRKKI